MKSALGLLLFTLSLFLLVPPVQSQESEPYSIFPKIVMAAITFFGYLMLRSNVRELGRVLATMALIYELLAFVAFGVLVYYRVQI